MGEHIPYKDGVAGSSPAPPTIIDDIHRLMKLLLTLFLSAGLFVQANAQTFLGFSADDILAKKRSQRALYETYTRTDDGLTSVFGFIFDSYITENYYYAISIYGAVGGNEDRGGYGLAMFGLGYNYPLTRALYFDTNFMIGSGGGGYLDAGGGSVEHFQYGFQYFVTSRWFVEAGIGHLRYNPHLFSTPIYTMGIGYRNLRFLVDRKGKSDE